MHGIETIRRINREQAIRETSINERIEKPYPCPKCRAEASITREAVWVRDYTRPNEFRWVTKGFVWRCNNCGALYK